MGPECKQLLRASKRFLALALLAAGACSPIVDNRGHSTQDLDLSQITPGTTRHEDVEALLGSPSLKSDYGDVWYYVSAQKETSGVFAPEITKQKVIEISFDESGAVKDVAKYSKEDGKAVALVEKSTPSAGHSLTFMEQLLSNFGKFGTPGREITPGRSY